MALQISFLLILTGLTGIDSVTTVSKVSVKAGHPITIPCLYEAKYREKVKYLCEGYNWNSCSYAIRTDQRNSHKFSIYDDKKQRIFTVTIKGQTHTEYYWCNVEIDRGADDGQRFQLSVTKGTPILYVDQQTFTAFRGESIFIPCYNGNKWCRFGGACVTKSGLVDGTNVTITRGSSNSFNVSMSGLKTENSGWYLCVRGDLQMPVHLTVNEKPIFISTTTTTTNTSTEFSEQDSDGSKMIIILLILLVLLVMIILFTWFLFRRYKQQRPEVPTTTTVEEEVTYSTIDHTSKTKRKAQAKAQEDHVIYSTWAQQK